MANDESIELENESGCGSEGFVMTPRVIFMRDDLSLAARALYGYLNSNISRWEIKRKVLESFLGSDHLVRKATKELKDADLLEIKNKLHPETKQFCGKKWVLKPPKPKPQDSCGSSRVYDLPTRGKNRLSADHTQSNKQLLKEKKKNTTYSSSAAEKSDQEKNQEEGEGFRYPLPLEEEQKRAAEDSPGYSPSPSGQKPSAADKLARIKQAEEAALVKHSNAAAKKPPRTGRPPSPAAELVQHYYQVFLETYPHLPVKAASSRGAEVGKAKVLLAAYQGDVVRSRALVTFWITQFKTLKCMERLSWDLPTLGGLVQMVTHVAAELETRHPTRTGTRGPVRVLRADFSLEDFETP